MPSHQSGVSLQTNHTVYFGPRDDVAAYMISLEPIRSPHLNLGRAEPPDLSVSATEYRPSHPL